MISKILYAISRGVRYVTNHPHVLFVFVIIIILPLLFLYSSQQFLDAGRSNQDRLQKDKLGLLHDAFATIIKVSGADAVLLQQQISQIAGTNPDIVAFRVVVHDNSEVRVVAALDQALVGTTENDATAYRYSTINQDESLIFPYEVSGERVWQGFRSVEHDGLLYTIFTEQSLTTVDAVFTQREQGAYFVLVIVYLFLLGLAYWHVRSVDYRYLYQKEHELNETKDMFTNMIVHELRAPLTAIRGYGSMLAESTAITSEEREYVGRIRQSSDRLLAIINDFLEVARIQSGKLTVRATLTDVSEVVVKACNELTAHASEKQISLLHTNTDTPHCLTTDPARLQQILVNLVNNSIKYSQQGTIEVAISESTNVLEIRVKDSGMGIHAEDQKKLFAPFFRVAGEETVAITGSGLGMWITKQLVEALDGTIGVESIKGVGTNVVVTFDKRKLAAKKAE